MNLSLKNFFTFLIIFIVLLFFVNFFYSKNIAISNIQITPENKTKKTVGINIEHNNLRGESIKISAQELDEDLKEKLIKLKYTVTTITNKNMNTKINADFATIKNYDHFELKKNVKIINENRKFILKTDKLTGRLNNGSMYSENKVDIKIRNSTISGTGLKLLNNGEYIKNFGKATLTTNYYD